MELEKISLCQYRANCNVLSRKLEKSAQKQSAMSVQNLKKSQRLEKSPKVSKKTSKDYEIIVTTTEFPSKYPVVPYKELENLGKPLLPPGTDQSTQRSHLEKKRKFFSPSMSEEFYAEILSSNAASLNSTKKPASLSRSMSLTLYPNKEKYETLLAKKHGFIPPRKK